MTSRTFILPHSDRTWHRREILLLDSVQRTWFLPSCPSFGTDVGLQHYPTHLLREAMHTLACSRTRFPCHPFPMPMARIPSTSGGMLKKTGCSSQMEIKTHGEKRLFPQSVRISSGPCSNRSRSRTGSMYRHSPERTDPTIATVQDKALALFKVWLAARPDYNQEL